MKQARCAITAAITAATALCLALVMTPPGAHGGSSPGSALPAASARTVSVVTAGYSAMAYTPHGMASIAFKPSVRAADGIVPPSNPPNNLPGNENIPGCQASPPWDYPTTPITSPACTSAALARLRIDRAVEGLGPVVLPANWASLSIPEQMFVITNLERTARGLAPLAGLTTPLDTAATLGAAHGIDPLPCSSLTETSSSTFTCPPGTELPVIGTERSIWAGGQPSPITADMGWMYNDGWGGSRSSTTNYDCTGPTAPGCWGHRDAILGSYRCPYCYAGAAFAPTGWPLTTGGGAASYAELFASYTTPQPTVFSWASELPYLGIPAPPGEPLTTKIAGGASNTTSGGYWLASAHGAVFSQGKAQFHGSVTGLPVAEQPTSPVVGIVANPGGGGYWLVTSAGDIYSFGKAAFHGSTGAIVLNKPIVGMATTPHGNGYWLVAADGGIFAFGSAKFYGSMGATPLNKPIVGMASTPNGQGYWLVAADGGIFSFGDAAFHGSTGAITLAKPIVGMASTPHGNGYWLAASDGGVFAFGTAKFYGSGPDIPTTGPTSGIAATRSGYELIQADGNIHVFSPGTTTATTTTTQPTTTTTPQPSPPTAPPLSAYLAPATLGGCYSSADQPISCNTVSEQQLQSAVGKIISGQPISLPSTGQSGIVSDMEPSVTTMVTSTQTRSLFTDTVNLQTYAGFPDPLDPGHGLWSSADIEGAPVSATVPSGCHLAATPAPTNATGDTVIYYWCPGNANSDAALEVTADQMPWIESAPGGNSQIVLRSQPVSASGMSSTGTGSAGGTGTTDTNTPYNPSSPPFLTYLTTGLWAPGSSCMTTTAGVTTPCPTITQQDLTTVAGKQYPQSADNNNTWLYQDGVPSSAVKVQANMWPPQMFNEGGRLHTPPEFWAVAIGVNITANDIPDPLDPGHMLWNSAGIQGITTTVSLPPGCTFRSPVPATGPNGDTIMYYWCKATSSTPPPVPAITFQHVPQIENLADGNFQITMGSQQLLASQLQTL